MIRVVNPWCSGGAIERCHTRGAVDVSGALVGAVVVVWCVWCGCPAMCAKNDQADITSPWASHRSIAKQVSDASIQNLSFTAGGIVRL